MKKTLSHMIKTTALPLALVAPIASAQEETIVVNANDPLIADAVAAFKTSTQLKDVPQSLSVYTEEQLKEQGLLSIGDIVDYTPGVTNSQGEGHRDAVVFRGVRSTADFFVDGVRDDVQYYRPLYNVEQVEILRGPNALFFGRGGAGGVINRVMKKAEVGEAFTELSGSIDTFGATSTAIDTNYAIDDTKALRFNAHHDHLAGHRDHYDGNLLGINPTFTYELGEDTTLRLSYEHMNHERFIDRGIPTGLNGKPVSSFEDVVFGDAELNLTTLEAHILRASIQHHFSDSWTLNATTSFGTYDKLYQNFYVPDIYGSAENNGYDAVNNVVALDGYRDTTERDVFVYSADLVGEFTTGALEHKVVIGAEYSHTSNDNDRYNANFTHADNSTSDTELVNASNFTLRNGVLTNINGDLSYNDFNQKLNDRTEVDVNTFSFFLQDEVAVTDQLDVILGARFDHFNIDFKNRKNGATASQSDDFISPRLGLVFRPIEDLSLYASYSQTYLPGSGEQYANIGDQLDPDDFTNLEAGIKYDLKDDLSFTASFFQIDQTFTSADKNNRQVEEEGEINGFELQLKGFVTNKWFISAGYSYLDGELANGGTPREIPENSFSIWNNYAFTEQFGLGLGIIYQGESQIENGAANPVLPSYTRVDASAYYNFNDSFRVQLNVENLLNTDYYPTAHSTHQVSVGAPINARLSAIVKF